MIFVVVVEINVIFNIYFGPRENDWIRSSIMTAASLVRLVFFYYCYSTPCIQCAHTLKIKRYSVQKCKYININLFTQMPMVALDRSTPTVHNLLWSDMRRCQPMCNDGQISPIVLSWPGV